MTNSLLAFRRSKGPTVQDSIGALEQGVQEELARGGMGPSMMELLQRKSDILV